MATKFRNEAAAISAEVRSFLTDTPPRYAVIATSNADGSPNQRVIWYLTRRDGNADVLIVNSRHGRRWPANVQRTGVASVAVHDGVDAVTLLCDVIDTYDDERAHDDINEMARRYDPPERRDERMARFRDEERVSFVLVPRRVDVHGNPR